MTIPSNPGDGSQSGLFDEDPPAQAQDEEPKPNSPEDLGMVTTRRGEKIKLYGKSKPEPDPMPVNLCSSAISWEDVRKFIAWIHDQDIPTHARITLGGIVVNLSGLGVPDLRWLCGAIRQVGRAPSPELMFRAVTTRDVAVLREEPDD